MADKLDALTQALDLLTATRAAVAALPRMKVEGAAQQADLDAAGVSYGACISLLDKADRHLRVARALLAYAHAEPVTDERLPTC